MSRVELFEQIRRDERDEKLSIRALAERHRVHRRTVRQALESAVPPPRKIPERDSPQLGPHIAVIRGWLEADLDAPVKQRHTARRVWQRLVDEHDATVAESTVRAFVAEVKRELGLSGPEAMVPQSKPPGWEAEVDFGELKITLDGAADQRVWMFVMRLSSSGRTFRRVYGNETIESFLDGHVRAFEFFGGVPVRVRYDNLRPAVTKVLLGKLRELNPRFVALRSHYLFDTSFCAPGKGHEKGGVEGEIGRFRRNWLTPVPDVADLDELNVQVDAAVDVDDGRRTLTRDGTVRTVADWWALEAPLLAPLPAEPADVVTELSCRVDTRARICVRQAFYSVPTRHVGQRVRVLLAASHLAVFDGPRPIATHPRSLHKGTETLTLDHYLEILGRKPGALAGATALAQARADGRFTAVHQAWWDLARRQLGDSAGTRGLIDLLLEHRRLPTAALQTAMADAVDTGIVDVQVVIVEARRHADQATRPTDDLVVSQDLARFDRPAPDLAAYDQLLKDSA